MPRSEVKVPVMPGRGVDGLGPEQHDAAERASTLGFSPLPRPPRIPLESSFVLDRLDRRPLSLRTPAPLAPFPSCGRSPPTPLLQRQPGPWELAPQLAPAPAGSRSSLVRPPAPSRASARRRLLTGVEKTGTSHPELAQLIARRLGLPLGASSITVLPSGELSCVALPPAARLAPATARRTEH